MTLYLFFWMLMGTTYEDRDPMLNYNCVSHEWNNSTVTVLRHLDSRSCRYYKTVKAIELQNL